MLISAWKVAKNETSEWRGPEYTPLYPESDTRERHTLTAGRTVLAP